MLTGSGTITLSKNLHDYAKNLSVLYVEDSLSMRNATKKMLSQYFDHIDTAVDGIEGFNLYRNFHIKNDSNYNIVISDLEMPNMGGEELSKKILSIDPSQVIIIISSSNDLSVLIGLLNLGIQKFLSKPIQQQQLHTIISDIVDQLHHQKLKSDDLNDISMQNKILQRREEIYLSKLEKSNKELKEFNDALNESGIVSKTDTDGVITYVNQKFCEISGYQEDELIGKKHSIVNSGEMSPSFFEKLWHTITNQKSYKGVFKNKSKDGSIYYVESLIKPIVGVEGETNEFISIAHDITRMMSSIKTAHDAEKAKDDFFRNISHEMRTPLNSILGLTSLLRRRAKDEPKFLDMLKIIENNGQNLAALVESVLDLQRLQYNQFELDNKEFQISSLYAFISTLYTSKAKEKGLHFDHVLDKNTPSILIGDLVRIQQIIMVIMDNAIKFTPEAGRVYFNISYSYDTSSLMLHIQDSGIGITLEDQEKIFTLTQLDSSVTRKHEGAGLGLTIAHAIITKMNGTITLHSIPDQGSTFLIEIPLKHP